MSGGAQMCVEKEEGKKKSEPLACIDLKRKGIGILHIHKNHATKVKAPNEKQIK
jgi:hypothetical protein